MNPSSALLPSTASKFLNILNTLGCPYTQDVDESYIGELLLTEGEHRIRLLLWIFGKIHSNIEEIVNAHEVIMRQGTPQFGVDKRVQILTSLAASFGICKAVDFDLIRGHTSTSKQISFWKKIFDIIQPCSDEAHRADEQVMDAILNHENNLVFSSVSEQLELLPHNLRKEMSLISHQKNCKRMGFSEFEDRLGKLNEDLKVQREKLSELEESLKYTSKDCKNTLNSVSCKLNLTLSDLDQMMTTFEQVFTNNYLPYCNKQKEEFGNIGPLIKIVSKQLSYVIGTFDNLQNIIKSHDAVVPADGSKSVSKLSAYIPVLENFLSNSLNCLDQLTRTMKNRDSANATGLMFESNGGKINDTISDISTIK